MLIYQERVVPEEEYSFHHVLTQETIYQGLLKPRRSQLHQQVAEAIEALYPEGLEEHYEQLAYHYERSGAEEKAVEYLLKAGEKARRAYLNEAAIGYFQRALKRLDRGVESSELSADRAAKAGPSDLSTLNPQLSTDRWRLAALRGLGQVQYGIGQIAEAEPLFRQAIALGQEIGLPVPELIPLYHQLGDLKYWQGRWDEQIQLGAEGLALVGDQTDSLEAALMNALVGWAYYFQGDWRRAGEYVFRNAEFVARLPYTEELRPVYIYIALAYLLFKKDAEQAFRWAEAFRRAAEEHHDLRALGNVYFDVLPGIRSFQGDVRGALADRRRGLALFRQIGDAKHEANCQLFFGGDHLALGDLAAAQEAYLLSLEHFEGVENWQYASRARRGLGVVALCEGQIDRAVALLHQVLEVEHEGWARPTVPTRRVLGRVLLLLGEREEAAQHHEQVIRMLVKRESDRRLEWLLGSLSGLEAAWGDRERFRRFCERLRAESPGSCPLPRASTLEPAQAGLFPPSHFGDDFSSELAPGWTWQDPFGDSRYHGGSGLQIHAANARDLWKVNLSAPRLMRAAAGEFAVQTICRAASAEKLAMGGLLLWKDRQNYLRLGWGMLGPGEVTFQGCRDDEDLLFGRGRLPGERIHLRLERRAGRVRALCSADGAAWFTLGEAEFSAEDPVEAGLLAIGQIDRVIYPGAYPEGTAICFEAFQW